MHLFRQIFFIVTLAVCSKAVFALEAMDDLAQRLNSLHSMQANFNQQVLDGKGQVMQQSVGKFALLRPGKFRWETEKPTKQLLIADGKRIWIYDQDLQQATVQKQDNHSANSPAMLLSGSVATLKKNFKVQYINKPKQPGVWFALQPVNKNAMFQSVELNFNAGNLQIMRLTDNLGQASNLKFSSVRNNANLPANQFTFTPSKGVDVIDQTKFGN